MTDEQKTCPKCSMDMEYLCEDCGQYMVKHHVDGSTCKDQQITALTKEVEELREKVNLK